MKDLINAAEGWANFIRAHAGYLSDDSIEMANDRAEVCRKCPELKRVEKDLMKKHPYRCGVCGCFFPAIAYAKRKKCPLDKWKK